MFIGICSGKSGWGSEFLFLLFFLTFILILLTPFSGRGSSPGSIWTVMSTPLLWMLGLVIGVTLAPLGERVEMMLLSYGEKAEEAEAQIGMKASPSSAAKCVFPYLIISIALTLLKFSLFCLQILLLGFEAEEGISKGPWVSKEP